jgi:hypothetical protein
MTEFRIILSGDDTYFNLPFEEELRDAKIPYKLIDKYDEERTLIYEFENILNYSKAHEIYDENVEYYEPHIMRINYEKRIEDIKPLYKYYDDEIEKITNQYVRDNLPKSKKLSSRSYHTLVQKYRSEYLTSKKCLEDRLLILSNILS